MPILNWLTRDDDTKAAVKVPYRLLEEVPEHSAGATDTGNMLIQGDNLKTLKTLRLTPLDQALRSNLPEACR